MQNEHGKYGYELLAMVKYYYENGFYSWHYSFSV
jgi:hypothetical protein